MLFKKKETYKCNGKNEPCVQTTDEENRALEQALKELVKREEKNNEK